MSGEDKPDMLSNLAPSIVPDLIKATKGFEQLTNISSATGQLTGPVAGAANIVSNPASISGGLFGEVKTLDMKATPDAIAGNAGGQGQDSGDHSAASHGGGGGGYDPGHSENYSQLASAGQDIMSGAGVEHHDHLPSQNIQPSAGGISQQSSGQEHDH